MKWFKRPTKPTEQPLDIHRMLIPSGEFLWELSGRITTRVQVMTLLARCGAAEDELQRLVLRGLK